MLNGLNIKTTRLQGFLPVDKKKNYMDNLAKSFAWQENKTCKLFFSKPFLQKLIKLTLLDPFNLKMLAWAWNSASQLVKNFVSVHPLLFKNYKINFFTLRSNSFYMPLKPKQRPRKFAFFWWLTTSLNLLLFTTFTNNKIHYSTRCTPLLYSSRILFF